MKQFLVYALLFVAGALSSYFLNSKPTVPGSAAAASAVTKPKEIPCPPDTVKDWTPSRCTYNREKFKIEYLADVKMYTPRLKYSNDFPNFVYIWDGVGPGGTSDHPIQGYADKADCIEYINIWEDNLLHYNKKGHQ